MRGIIKGHMPPYQPWFVLLKLCFYKLFVRFLDLQRLAWFVAWEEVRQRKHLSTVIVPPRKSILHEVHKLRQLQLAKEIRELNARLRELRELMMEAEGELDRPVVPRKRVVKVTSDTLADISRCDDDSVVSQSSSYFSLHSL